MPGASTSPDREPRGLRRLLGRGGRRLVASLTADVVRHLDVSLIEVKAGIARIDAAVTRIDATVTRVDATVTRVDVTAAHLDGEAREELRRLISDQVDGANDADEILGRVLAGLRRDIDGLATSVGALEARLGGLDLRAR